MAHVNEAGRRSSTMYRMTFVVGPEERFLFDDK